MIGPGKVIAAAIITFTFLPQGSQELKAPFKVLADGEAIDVEKGHAAPCFADFDGDGLNDLLVGQFGGGKLRIYRNFGTATEPKFEDFEYFSGTVPAS